MSKLEIQQSSLSRNLNHYENEKLIEAFKNALSLIVNFEVYIYTL